MIITNILINNTPYPTTVGETFISTEIGIDAFESGEMLRVAVMVSDLGIISEPYMVAIE